MKTFSQYLINEDLRINFLGGINPKLQAILDKFPKEYARVMAGAELSDRRNVQFFDAVYEYFYDEDPVAAKRQSEDTEEFVWERLMDIGDSHSQRWGVAYARDLVKELKKAKIKHKTDKRYKVEVDIQSYNKSALADKKSIGEFIADMQKKNATVDFTER